MLPIGRGNHRTPGVSASASAGIDARVNLIANAERPMGDFQVVQVMALRFSGVGYLSGRVLATQMTAVTHLPATLPVKRRTVENDDARLIRTKCIHGFALDDDRQHSTVSFVRFIPKEARFPSDADRLAIVHFESSVIL